MRANQIIVNQTKSDVNIPKCESNAHRLEACVQILLLLIQCWIRWDVIIERWHLIATASTTRRATRWRIVEWNIRWRLRHYWQ